MSAVAWSDPDRSDREERCLIGPETLNGILVTVSSVIRDPALILVDFQNSFCTPAHNEQLASDNTALRAVRRAVDRASAFAEQYRQPDRTPIFIRSINEQADQSSTQTDKGQGQGPPPCLPGSSQAQFDDGLTPSDNDIIVTKRRYDGFQETELETLLPENEISSLLIGGINTHICVLSTAFSAINRDYDVTVLSDCSAASSTESHESGIDILSVVATNVTPSTDISIE